MSSRSARPSHTPCQTRADMNLTGVRSWLRCGKTPGARSLLHDDMTVIVIDFVDMSKMHLRAQALQMDLPPSPPPTNTIPKPVIQASLIRATEQMMALPTPPAQRMGSKVRPPPPPSLPLSPTDFQPQAQCGSAGGARCRTSGAARSCSRSTPPTRKTQAPASRRWLWTAARDRAKGRREDRPRASRRSAAARRPARSRRPLRRRQLLRRRRNKLKTLTSVQRKSRVLSLHS